MPSYSPQQTYAWFYSGLILEFKKKSTPIKRPEVLLALPEPQKPVI
jgi:hypothetical protein